MTHSEPETTASRIARIAPDVSESRRKSLEIAADLGADDATLATLAGATKVSRRSTIVLPTRYGHTSRAKGWARQGRGDSAVWGEEESGGYRVGAGKWLVHSSDGFRREERITWVAQHVQVGSETWTIAD